LICASKRFVVDTLSDLEDPTPGNGICGTGTGTCSLRAALQTVASVNEPAWIDLGSGTYAINRGSVDPSQLHAEHGDLDAHTLDALPHHVLIVGEGVMSTTLNVTHGDRALDVHPDMHLVVEDLTITGGGGASDVSGAAIRVRETGHVELHRVNLINNSTHNNANGGAIIVQNNPIASTALFSQVRVEANNAGARGGAIYARGNIEIYDSLIIGNTAGRGAGVFVGDQGNAQSGDVLLVNTTLSDNTADIYSGAIMVNRGNLVLLHASVVRNTSMSSEAIYIDASGTGTFYNSVIADNYGSAEPDCKVDPAGGLGTRGVNFLGSDQNCIAYFEAQDVLPQGGVNQDPLVNSMSAEVDYQAGHSPTATSPLLGAANLSLCQQMDQRGNDRRGDGLCDIGALER
jgi:CSLREA domain-containing protein